MENKGHNTTVAAKALLLTLSNFHRTLEIRAIILIMLLYIRFFRHNGWNSGGQSLLAPKIDLYLLIFRGDLFGGHNLAFTKGSFIIFLVPNTGKPKGLDIFISN